MSFVGIAIFYVTIPVVSTEKSLAMVIQEAIRPVAMLFFIEALAWFLLKQHRSAYDDYTKFLRTANRCANLLTSHLIINAQSTAEERKFLLEELMKNPINCILKEGETTEFIEMQKISDSNPVFDIFKKAIDTINQKQDSK